MNIRTWSCYGLLLLALFFPRSSALAAIPVSLYDPANCTKSTTAPLNYVICNDGVPAGGGRVPNVDGAKAVTVPAEYEGYVQLPNKKTPTAVPGADGDGNIALDVDVSLPLTPPPPGGYPLMFFMHGCCSGDKTSWEATDFEVPADKEKWHYNNAWFASRGYVVVTYTARGFVDGKNQGSTGETQLDSRRFEGNDFQHLACQIYANAGNWSAVTGQTVAINPSKVVLTGGSYGGGFAWLGITDPKWTCNAETVAEGAAMQVAAAAPKYTWTDLLYSLVPTGRHLQNYDDPLPATDGCDSGPLKRDGTPCDPQLSPVGIPKASINAALYASGTTGVPPGSHTTFPPEITEAITCLEGDYPPETNPACTMTLAKTLPEFMSERSAYYQKEFWDNIETDPGYRVPIFLAATLTDPLFPPSENRRMINRLRKVVPGYPIQAYFGDYQHFVQNKRKEWADICGTDRHVCTNADYPGLNFNADPTGLVRTGVTTRINRFIDFYAKPAGNPKPNAPKFNVTVALQICPQNVPSGQTSDDPGDQFAASSFERLTDGTYRFESATGQITMSTVVNNSHAIEADPIANFAGNGGACPHNNTPAGLGVAVYDSPLLSGDLVMIGATTLTLEFIATGDTASIQLNTRMYDVFPDGSEVMVDRGPRRISAAEVAAKTVTYQLHSNGWRFPKGHKIRFEIAQDDAPFVKNSTLPSSTIITHLVAVVPTRSIPVSGKRDSGP